MFIPLSKQNITAFASINHSAPEKQVEAAIIDGQVVYSYKSAHAGEDGTENGEYISDEKECFQKETVPGKINF